MGRFGGVTMEEDINSIKEKVEAFMRKYNVAVQIETVCAGRSCDGKIVNAEARLIITT